MSTTKEQLTYPDINLAFIGAKNAIDLSNTYIKHLEKTKSFHHSQYSAKLKDFEKVDEKKDLIKVEYDEVDAFIKGWSKKHKVKVKLVVRKKDWVGFNAKILLYQLKEKNLNGIRDLLGFKLILLTEYPDTAKSHQLCYQLMNDLLDFFVFKRHCLLLEAEPKSGEPFDLSLGIPENRFVYPKNEIKSQYNGNVKNYLIEPKKHDFYQALHAYIQTSSDLVLEIQVHTIVTDIYAELHHQTYKDGRYADVHINIDFKKLNIPGLVFDKEGKILRDYTGIFLSDFDFLNRD